jgi:DNA-binding CsgD family transcriptional regulator
MNTQSNPLDPSIVVSATNPNTPPAKQKLISPSCLTDRQLTILRGVALGETTKGIAFVLKISPKTVEYHRMLLMIKLNLFSVPELVHYALATKLVLSMFDVTFTEVVKTEVTVDIGEAKQNWTAPLKRMVSVPKKKPVYVHYKQKPSRRGTPSLQKYANVFGMA